MSIQINIGYFVLAILQIQHRVYLFPTYRLIVNIFSIQASYFEDTPNFAKYIMQELRFNFGPVFFVISLHTV
jgi:hypothetical protein